MTMTRQVTVRDESGSRDVDIYTPEGFQLLTELWTRAGWQHKFSYELTWLGVPIIQLPEDLLMLQELVYKVRPDIIIETGTAHGGTAVFYASLLELLGGHGRVLSIDVEIRKYNRLAIQSHPMSRRITLIEGSSVDPDVVEAVRRQLPSNANVLVCLDSNHTAQHVRAELANYAPFVTPGSYLVVFDGIMERVADAPNAGVGWDRDNPLVAVREFLQGNPEFEVDRYYNRLRTTYCEDGFLRRRWPPQGA